MLAVLKQFSKFSITSAAKIQANTRYIHIIEPLNLRITQPLCAEPMKKRKKIDPAIVKAREERRRKKIEKQIRRLEKNARQLKPIDELEVPLHILDSIDKRRRPVVKLSAEVVEARQLLEKDWARYKTLEHVSNVMQIDRIMNAQKKALNKLYEESEDLYNEAIMPDLQLIPYAVSGPVATPPIKNYDSPDGEYIDVSKKWDN